MRVLSDLDDLKLIVKDKRVAKRADAKKERRNRHYVKVLIKSQLNNRVFAIVPVKYLNVEINNLIEARAIL